MDEFLSDESSRRHSCIKNITMGVPIGSWITHYDQSMTAFLVTDMLKVGLIVREWQKREEMVIASTMRNVEESCRSLVSTSNTNSCVDNMFN